MINIARWKIILILLVSLLGVLYALPNITGTKAFSALPSWMPGKTMNLGLDLQGGSHILLDVGIETVFEEQFQSVEESARAEFEEEKLLLVRSSAGREGVEFTFRPGQDLSKARGIIRRLLTGADIATRDDTTADNLHRL